MSTSTLYKTQKTIKDLILFDSTWNKRHKIKTLSKQTIERIGVYRQLVYNSFYDLLTSVYPNAYELLKKGWEKLLHDYIEAYPPTSPILNKVVEHFPKFLSKQKKILKKYPFIVELSTYEWLELEVSEKENIEKTLVNPAHVLCHFQYPIPEILEMIKNKKLNNKIKPKETNLLIYRDPKDFTVRFFELSHSTLSYIELLKKRFTHNKTIQTLAKIYQIQKKDFGTFKKQANKLVKTLKGNRIIVTT